MDQEVIADLYKKFRDPLKNFIAKRVSDSATAEDMVHDVFLRIHAHLPTLKDSQKLTAWIYQIARNSIIDFHRKKKDLTSEIPENLVNDEELTPNAAENLTSSIRGMIEKLPDTYRQTLIQADFEGKKHSDIAKDLGISVSGVKSRVQRARHMLKELLLQCCHFEFDRYGTVFEYFPKKCERCCGNNKANQKCIESTC